MDSSELSKTEKQISKRFEKQITITLSANYLLYLPDDYAVDNKQFPLVLSLHGGVGRGNDLEKVKLHGLPKLIETGKDFPFIVVSPQCPEKVFWNIDTLIALLDEIETKYRIDKKRIYVTGFSMGGNATWSLAIAQPNRFAAIVPISGWGDFFTVCQIAHLPIWVFHGAKDDIVPVKAAEDMVNTLIKCGSKVKFTIYPEAKHDCWTETYNNKELYKWMLEQSL